MIGNQYSPCARCTLLVPTPLAHRQGLNHLMLVITDPVNIPPPSVIVTPLNSYFDGCDNTCILDVGDHAFVVKKSFVNFKESRIREVSKIVSGVENNVFSPHADLTEVVHSRVCEGFECSDAMDTLVKGIYKRFKRESDNVA